MSDRRQDIRSAIDRHQKPKKKKCKMCGQEVSGSGTIGGASVGGGGAGAGGGGGGG